MFVRLMKKQGGIIIFLMIIFSAIVSAGPVEGLQQLTEGLREMIVVIIQFFGSTILDINSFNEFLFAKILLFTLILLVVYTVIKENKLLGGRRNKPIHWIISVSISILAVKYLPDGFIQAILIQYGALAIGITVFLPLIIYFFFIHQSKIGPFGRRIAWIVFATAFFALWSFRSADISGANWIYGIGTVFILISIIFDKVFINILILQILERGKKEIKLEQDES